MTGRDFAVSADLTPGKSNGEYGHTGFIIDGIHFMLYANGKAGTAYRPPTYKRSLGQAAAIPGYTFGDTCNVTVIRQYNGKSRKYVFQVNGRPLISFQDSDMVPTDTVKIYAYRAKLAIDNVAIHSVSRGSDSPNLVINSSFEHLLDGMPIYVNLTTNRSITWKTPYSEYLKTVVIDTKEKHSGNNSLRLTFNDSVSKAGFLMWSAGLSLFTPTSGWAGLKKVAVHPTIIAVYLGLIRMFTGFSLPGFLDSAVGSIGDCTSPLAMMLVGVILAQVPLRDVVELKVFYLVLVRQILFPAACLAVLKALAVDPLTIGVSVVLSGMPIGSTTAILAAKYGADARYGSKCVFISTVTSLLTVPLLTLFL